MAHRSKFSRAPAVEQGDDLYTPCSKPGHGAYTAAKVEQFDGTQAQRGCPRCRWEALNLADAGSEARSVALAAKQAERVNELLIGSGITPRFVGCTLDSYRADGNSAMETALSVCRGYVNAFEKHYDAGRCLLLLGNVGTGKTHLASAMVQEIIRRYVATAIIVPAGEVIRVAKGSMDRSAGYSEQDVLAELASADLLVLDEIGAQAGTEYERGLFHEIIDRRYQLVLPTVVVSNLSADKLANYIGERALDRLRQGGGLMAGFTWDSLRRQV